MADEAVLGFGARFYLNDGTSLVELDGVVGISPPSPEVGNTETTHMGSAGGARTFMATLIDYGSISVRLFWSPGSATDTKVMAFMAGRTKRPCKLVVTETDGTFQMMTCDVLPMGIDYDEVVIDDKMTYVLKAKVTGAVTQADYS